ncbi:MAG: hypothetical protein ACRENQ_05475 [Gemmatimonadaceae bacterium]
MHEHPPGGPPVEGPAASALGARQSANSEGEAYAPPSLLVYGVVRDLTSSGGRKGKKDKAVKHSKTGF